MERKSLKKKLNNYGEFEPFYHQVVSEFGYDIKLDKVAVSYLSKILNMKSNKYDLNKILKSFQNLVRLKNKILIYGCGPSLLSTVNFIIQKTSLQFFSLFTNIAADGSLILLSEKRIKVDAVFTDLDGIEYNDINKAKYVIIHAHGDNISKLHSFKNQIIKKSNIIGTGQSKPKNRVLNPGGFTDGDRILYFLKSLINPEQKLFLIGMDFDSDVGKYSKPYFTEDIKPNKTKLMKLQKAKELLMALDQQYKKKITFVSTKPISEDFNHISLEDFIKIK